MNLCVVGCSHHKTSVEVREKLAFSDAQVTEFVQAFAEEFPSSEAVLLSTCNRTEFYAATKQPSAMPVQQQLVSFLASQANMNVDEIENQMFSYRDQDAVQHLFKVTSSLDSMVIGETQILSQVRRAYQLAGESGISLSLMHQIFQNAIRVARRISNETQLHANRVSVPSVAICELAKQIFETLKGKNILIIGAGEMADETLNYVLEQGGQNIVIVNRTSAAAKSLAEKFSGTVADWSQLPDQLVDADLVISTTGAQEPVVTLDMYQAVERRRRRSTLFVLDLAIPRDFDHRIAAQDDVYLYTLDDLQRECQRNQRMRESHYPKANRIVQQETQLFYEDVRRRSAGSTIAHLKEQAEAVKNSELERLKNRLNGIAPEHYQQIEKSFHRLVNKLLHPPLESLQKDVHKERPEGLLDALKKLFQLGE